MIVPIGSNKLHKVGLQGQIMTTTEFAKNELDGLNKIGRNHYVISSWGGLALYLLNDKIKLKLSRAVWTPLPISGMTTNVNDF